MSFIDSLTYYFIVIAEFGITTYGIRSVSRIREDKTALGKLISELLSLHLITSLIAILIYSIFLFFVYQKVGDYRLLLFSFSFLLVSSFSCEWYFWGTERFQFIAVRTIIIRLLGLISLFLLVRNADDYIIYYGITVLSASIIIFWNFYRMKSEVQINFKKKNLKLHYKQVILNYLISLSYSVPLLLDNVFLGFMKTISDVAYYAFSIKIVRLISSLITDSFLVFFPNAVYLLHHDKQQEAKFNLKISAEVIMLSTIPIAFGIFLLAHTFVDVYFGKNYGPVAQNMQILCLFPLVKSYSLFFNKQILMPYNKDALILKSLLTGGLVYIFLAVFLNPILGSYGASIAMLLSEVVILVLNYIYSRKIQGYSNSIQMSTFWQALISSLAFIPIIYCINFLFQDNVSKVILVISLCILAYTFFLLKVFKNSVIISLYESFLIKICK